MIEKPKHSVLMITYNQEGLIRNALDSIFSQSTLPYEVIISDDASTDDTWSIIKEYKKKYPKIIKAKTNEQNLGIFGNINSILKTASGDIVSFLSGDDYFNPNLFSELNRVVEKNNVNLEEDFIIIANFEFLYSDGSKRIFDNYRLSNEDIFKQRIRYGIFHREIGISNNILKKIDYCKEDIGVHADWIFALDMDYKAEKYYFSSFSSCVYRVGVGIVSKSKSIEMYSSRIKAIEIIKEKFNNRLDEDDLKYLDFEKKMNEYLIIDNVNTYLKYLLSFSQNLKNFSSNNPWNTRDRLSTILPPKVRRILKKIRGNLK